MPVTNNEDFGKQLDSLVTEALKCKVCELDFITFRLDIAYHQMAQMYSIEAARHKVMDATLKKALKDGTKIQGN